MKFTETHEWIELSGNIGIVGITEYAQKELGEIVYVELPKIGKNVKAGEEIAVLESTKAAADIYTPVSGTILEVNEALNSSTDSINQSPQSYGWIFKIQIHTPEELESLMDEEAYQIMLKKS